MATVKGTARLLRHRYDNVVCIEFAARACTSDLGFWEWPCENEQLSEGMSVLVAGNKFTAIAKSASILDGARGAGRCYRSTLTSLLETIFRHLGWAASEVLEKGGVLDGLKLRDLIRRWFPD